jgi:hypothetical protein
MRTAVIALDPTYRSSRATPPAGDRPCSGAVGTDIAALERIFDDAIAVAVWRRSLPTAFDDLLASNLPREEIVLRDTLRAAEPDFTSVSRALGAAVGGAVDALLRELVELYAVLADADSIGLRLAVTRGRPCPRFHVDRVGLRLICTLCGPGTEWLDGTDVDRRWLGAAGIADEATGLLRAGAVVHGLGTGDVGIFKGESWPGNHGRGAVHRSPASDGGWRLLVTLDSL